MSTPGMLTLAAIAVAVLACLVAGGQLVFTRRRMGDVAPVLVAGFVLGSLLLIARLLLPA